MKGLALIITNLCNMNCSFCLRGKDKSSIELKTVKKILTQIKPLGYDNILLTGGEAWMHPKFYELVDLIVKEGFGFTVVSNAKNYEKYLLLLKYGEKFNWITFSLDGGEKTHDSFRGRGSYQKVLSAIKEFSSKIPVKITMCLNKSNLREIPEVIKAAELNGAKQINFTSVIPTGTNNALVLSDIEKQNVLQTIDSYRSQTKLKIITLSALRTLNGINFCVALDMTDLAVNPKGQLSFCCDIIGNGAVLGDLKKEKFEKLLEKALQVSIFLRKKRTECIMKNKKFEGFNTCYFCNKFLKKYQK